MTRYLYMIQQQPKTSFFFDMVSLIYLFLCRTTHLWPPHFLDFRILFRRPPTSPPLVACIWYSNNRKSLVFDITSFNIACVWYSKFNTVPPLLVFMCQVLEQSCLQIAIILHLNDSILKIWRCYMWMCCVDTSKDHERAHGSDFNRPLHQPPQCRHPPWTSQF